MVSQALTWDSDWLSYIAATRVEKQKPTPIFGDWMGKPDPTGLYAGIYYQFSNWTDFSDVIQVPRTDALLFVDDNKKRRLYLMQSNGSEQWGDPPQTLLLKNDIRLYDPEALTTDNREFVYICTSHCHKKKKPQPAWKKPRVHVFVRFRLDDRGRLMPDGLITNLCEMLCVQYEFIRRVAHLGPKKGGINIEGLAYDSRNGRLLIGLRSPLYDERACLIPVGIDPNQPFVSENLTWGEPLALQIPNKGVRSIQYDERLDAFLILAGNVRKGTGADFALWLWDGNPEGRCRRVDAVRFRDYFNPEGVSRVSLSTGEDYIFIVSDNGGGYMKLRYEELNL